MQKTLEHRYSPPSDSKVIDKSENKENSDDLDYSEKSEAPANHQSSSDTEIIQQRNQAYRALHELGKFLMEIDPHSPTPYLLELMVSWENKKLLEILSDISQGKSEAHSMLKLLAGSTSNR